MHRTLTTAATFVAGVATTGLLAAGAMAYSAAASPDVDRDAACRQAVVHGDVMVDQQQHIEGTSAALEIARDLGWGSKVAELEPKLVHMRETYQRTLSAYETASADCS